MAETEINKRMATERLAEQRAIKQIVLQDKVEEAPEGTLPRPIKELVGTAAEERVRIWARQSRQGLVQICNKKGCYYPLTPLRDTARDNEPLIAYENDEDTGVKLKVGIYGICSWAGKVHGEQIIRPAVKEEDI